MIPTYVLLPPSVPRNIVTLSMMERLFVDRKFWMAHARRKVATVLSVERGGYLFENGTGAG